MQVAFPDILKKNRDLWAFSDDEPWKPVAKENASDEVKKVISDFVAEMNGGGDENSFSIYKTDEDKRLVFGWASISITVEGVQLEDRQNDMIDPEDLEEAAYEYVLNFRDTGEEHIPSMRKKGKLVESCVFTEEKQQAMGIPAGTLPIGWWVGFKIEDDDAWSRVKNGTYRMFSIEGRASREPVEKANHVAKTFDEIIKYNDVHDDLGRFASKGGGGYSGKRMSNRAVRAYAGGEKPMSKWDKKTIIEEVGYYTRENEIDVSEGDLKKLTTKELQDNFLERTSWHHTGAFYNQTDFYSVTEDKLKDLSRQKIDDIISNRKPRKTKTSEEKAAEQKVKQTLEDSKQVYDKLEVIYNANTTGLKKLNSVANRWASGKLDLDGEYRKALEVLKEKERPRIEQWRKLPKDHWRQAQVKLFDTDFEAYARTNHDKNNRSKNVLNTIKEKIGKSYGVTDKSDRYDEIEEIEKAMTFDEIVEKANPYHDKKGRFTSASAAVTTTAIPGTKKPVATQTEHKQLGYLTFPQKVDVVSSDLGVDETRAWDMVASIQKYSGSVYAEIRQYQHSGPPPNMKAESDAIEEFIEKSPKWEGDVYRGIAMEPYYADQIIYACESGKIFSQNGSSSWSSSNKVAQNFANHSAEDFVGYEEGVDEPPVKIIFKSTGVQNGTSIRHLSMFYEENEVLMSKDARWKPTKVTMVDESNYIVECEPVA